MAFNGDYDPANSGGTTGAVGGASYEDVIDGTLDFYSAQLKNYPVANARNDGTNDSQEFRGLQGVTSRDAQNTARKSQLSFGLAQGTGILSRHSILPMTKIIKKISSGNIKFGVLSDNLIFNNISVTSEETKPSGIYFRSDGLKLYMVGSANNTVFEYNLGTAWDITTASYSGNNFSVSSEQTISEGLFFKDDGIKMYIVGANSDRCFEYNLGTAWDITTASYSGNNLDFSSEISSATGMYFKGDGLKLYIIGNSNDGIYEYNLGTAWDITTASYSGTHINISAQDGNPIGLFFKDDGTKMYMVGYDTDSVYEYNLGTAWDLSTYSLSNRLYVNKQDSEPRGMYFKGDGLKLYVVGNATNSIYEYDLQVAWEVRTAQLITFDLDIIINGTSNTYNIELDSLHLTSFLDFNILNLDISQKKIDIEILTKNLNNPLNVNYKLGFGLTGGDYNTPTGNYETSQLDILL